MNQTLRLKCQRDAHQIPWKVLVATDSRRWPWKSEPAKECVTTHLPSQLALKMDGAIKDSVKVLSLAAAVTRHRLACSIILAWNIGQRVGLYSRGTLDSLAWTKNKTRKMLKTETFQAQKGWILAKKANFFLKKLKFGLEKWTFSRKKNPKNFKFLPGKKAKVSKKNLVLLKIEKKTPSIS